MLKRQAADHQIKALYQLRVVTRLFALFVIVLLVVGYFLPKDYQISRSIEVDVPLSKVNDYFSQASHFSQWMYVANGQVESANQSLIVPMQLQIQYDSGELGELTLDRVSEQSIQFSVIPKMGQKAVSNVIELESIQSDRVLISWSIKGVLDSGIISPYLALFANKIAGANFEKSLLALKQQLEK